MASLVLVVLAVFERDLSLPLFLIFTLPAVVHVVNNSFDFDLLDLFDLPLNFTSLVDLVFLPFPFLFVLTVFALFFPFVFGLRPTLPRFPFLTVLAPVLPFFPATRPFRFFFIVDLVLSLLTLFEVLVLGVYPDAYFAVFLLGLRFRILCSLPLY